MFSFFLSKPNQILSTYKLVTLGKGDPDHPAKDIDLNTVNIMELDEDFQVKMKFYPRIPTPGN